MSIPDTRLRSLGLSVLRYVSPVVKEGLRGIFLTAVLLLTSFAAAHAQSPDVEAAKKEGSVSVYGSVVPQSMAINGGFEKKYGVRVEYWRADSTAIMERALT